MVVSWGYLKNLASLNVGQIEELMNDLVQVAWAVVEVDDEGV